MWEAFYFETQVQSPWIWYKNVSVRSGQIDAAFIKNRPVYSPLSRSPKQFLGRSQLRRCQWKHNAEQNVVDSVWLL